MTFKAGEPSANPNGRPKDEPRFLATLKRAIDQDSAVKLRSAADALLDKASEGEPWAIQMLADRLDGKPKQQVEGSGVMSLVVQLASADAEA